MADLSGHRGQYIQANTVPPGVADLEFEGQTGAGAPLANIVVPASDPKVNIGDLFPGQFGSLSLKFKARSRITGDAWGNWSPIQFFSLVAAPPPGDFIVVDV